MDLMRLPLGILTGVGFIGGGTILKKGDLVTGVTTAATLWLMTVIGLCLGGGQLILGTATTGLAVLTLWVLKWVDVMIPREHRARGSIIQRARRNGTYWKKIPRLVGADEIPCSLSGAEARAPDSVDTDYVFELSWRRPERASPPVELLRGQFARRFPPSNRSSSPPTTADSLCYAKQSAPPLFIPTGTPPPVNGSCWINAEINNGSNIFPSKAHHRPGHA